MKIGTRSLRCLPALAVLAFGIPASAEPDPHAGPNLEGAWQVSITLPNGFPFCAPAGAIATRDGLVIADSCYASEGPGYGVWERGRHGQYSITFIGNSFAPDGTAAGKYKVRASVILLPHGNTFTGQYQTNFFDTSGNPLGSVAGTLKGTRTEVEPLN